MTVTANLKTPIGDRFRRGALLLVPGTALLLLAGAGCGQEDGFAAEPETGAPDAADLRPAVETSPILSESLTDVLEISGRLEPRAEVMISSELGGGAEGVRFDKGDRIPKGAALARGGWAAPPGEGPNRPGP
ncbi:MAG: efflux RND transporter periplasmic adaptor subunit [Acidobacteria bacterium]|nr:efflux RND transporter periplasmic adaptor subunit [Acidobacteriota bacterium]